MSSSICTECGSHCKNKRDLYNHITRRHLAINKRFSGIDYVQKYPNNPLDGIMRFTYCILNHMNTHMVWKCYLTYLFDNLIQNPNDAFTTIHMKIVPKGVPLFDNAEHKPPFWTFCFIKSSLHPSGLFMFFSDSPDGVFKRLCKNHTYVLTGRTVCVIGENTIEGFKGINCYFDKKYEPEYVEMDWDLDINYFASAETTTNTVSEPDVTLNIDLAPETGTNPTNNLETAISLEQN